MMMGMEWLVWVAVVIVVLRLVSGRRHRPRGWLWNDDWLDDPSRDGRLYRGGHGRGHRGHRRGHAGRRLERRRDALEDAADRLEEASRRLRRKARGGRRTTGERRPSSASSEAPGSRRLSESSEVPGSRRSEGDHGSGGSSRNRTPVPRTTEAKLEALQRRFAEGRITMEQYERELDRLYGLS